MNTTKIIIPAAWTLSIAAAFIIGGKSQSPSSKETAATQRSTASERISARSRAGASGASDESSRKNALQRKGKRASESTEGRSISAITTNADPITRASDLLEYINKLGINDFEQAVTEFRALGITEDRMSEYSMLLHAWAKVDPLKALDFAEKNTGNQFARQAILASWATEDVDSALQWAREHYDGNKGNPWIVGVIKGIAQQDPSTATELMKELPYSRERGRALETIIPHIAAQGQEQALNWLNSLQDEKLRDGATSYLAETLAKSDPEGTAVWVSALDDSNAKSRAIRELASEWGNQDLQSAIAWTDSLRSENKTAAAREIIGDLAKEDPHGASSWLRTMTNDPDYHKVLKNYVHSTARTNPELSLSHVSEFSDQRSQDRYYEFILKDWRRNDPSSMEAWMQSHQVSDKVIKELNE